MMEKAFGEAAYRAWLIDQAALKRPYWYGTTHQQCSESLLARKTVQYPSEYKEGRMARYRQDIAAGQTCGDCVGAAVKGAAWTDLGAHGVKYATHGVPDYSADDMFDYCRKKGADWGAIATLPKARACLAVRMAGHVGVYIGDGKVVEWRGFNYGCVITSLSERKWTHWYELPWVEYENGELSAAALVLGDRLLKRGSAGEDVKALQDALNLLGFDAGEADGEFGPNTEAAVRRMQKRARITVDGQYGNQSHAALMVLLDSQDDHSGGSAESAPSAAVRVTASHAATVRAGAGTEYGAVSWVRRGAVLPLVARADNGWLAVQLSDRIGWISGKMAEVV